MTAEESSRLKLPDVALNYIHESQKIRVLRERIEILFLSLPLGN